MTKKKDNETEAQPTKALEITKPLGVEFTGEEIADTFGDAPVEYVRGVDTHTIKEVV